MTKFLTTSGVVHFQFYDVEWDVQSYINARNSFSTSVVWDFYRQIRVIFPGNY